MVLPLIYFKDVSDIKFLSKDIFEKLCFSDVS